MAQEVTNFARFYGILKKSYKFAGATDKPCGEGVRMLTQNCC